jgi:hydrogenase maturation factor
VTAGGAKSGDKLILTKTVGIEGTAILATDKERQLKKTLAHSLLQNARDLYNKISVVKEATTAFKAGGVAAMHDPTEGGVFGGIQEMADASKVGVKIREEKIPIAKETMEICKVFKIDPMQLISSGALLIAAKANFVEKILANLKRQNIEASVIGEFLDSPSKRLLIRKDGSKTTLIRPEYDHLWKALQEL